MRERMICLGECRTQRAFLCYESGKCLDCCENECGCDRQQYADKSRYDNLCESKWLKSLPEVG